jgi:hypothetical protein
MARIMAAGFTQSILDDGRPNVVLVDDQDGELRVGHPPHLPPYSFSSQVLKMHRRDSLRRWRKCLGRIGDTLSVCKGQASAIDTDGAGLLTLACSVLGDGKRRATAL